MVQLYKGSLSIELLDERLRHWLGDIHIWKKEDGQIARLSSRFCLLMQVPMLRSPRYASLQVQKDHDN